MAFGGPAASAGPDGAEKVIPRIHLEDSWKSIRTWDPSAESKVAYEFENVKNMALFATHLYRDDKLRSIALAQTCTYLVAWRCHVEDGTDFMDQPWKSCFRRDLVLETMQEKLTSVCEWYHFNVPRTIREMKSAVEFLDHICSYTRDGPHNVVFQGTLVCLKDTLVHLEYKSCGSA